MIAADNCSSAEKKEEGREDKDQVVKEKDHKVKISPCPKDTSGETNSTKSEELLELSGTTSHDYSKEREGGEGSEKKNHTSDKDSRTTGQTNGVDPQVDEASGADKHGADPASARVDESGRKCGHCGNSGPSSRWAKWHNHRGEPILICNPCNQHRKRRGNLLDRFCHRCGNPYVTQYRRAPRSSLVCYPCAELKPGVRELKATIDFNWFPGKPLPPSNKKKRKAWATAVQKAEAEAPPHVKARLAEEADRAQKEGSGNDDAPRKMALPGNAQSTKPEGVDSETKLGVVTSNPIGNPFGLGHPYVAGGVAAMGPGQRLGHQMIMGYPPGVMMPVQDVSRNTNMNSDMMAHILGQQHVMSQQHALNQQILNQQIMSQRQMAVRSQMMGQQMNPAGFPAQHVQVAGSPQMMMNPVQMFGGVVPVMAMQGAQQPQGGVWVPGVPPNQQMQQQMFGKSQDM